MSLPGPLSGKLLLEILFNYSQNKFHFSIIFIQIARVGKYKLPKLRLITFCLPEIKRLSV